MKGPKALLISAVAALAVGPGAASPALRDQITLSFDSVTVSENAWNVLVPNFERAYPNVTVNLTFSGTTAQNYALETTELAAGNGPDLLNAWPGCGTPISICEFAKDGYLAPMVNKPWPKRSLPLVTSASKYGQGLFMFSPNVSMFGIFTNDTLFKKLGLTPPQTFSQLLAVCQKAKANGVVPMELGASGSGVVQQLVSDVGLTTVYAKDPHWLAELKAGKETFDGTAGWHQALQELADLGNDGCLEPGPAATTSNVADIQFAEGDALMMVNLSTHKGTIDEADPGFAYSQRPFPGGTNPSRTVALLNMGSGPAVNAHASAANQAAAQQFVDFIARPKDDALLVQLSGGITQYEFLKGQIPSYLSSFTPLFESHEYGLNPVQTWWNADVGSALSNYGVGLLTGQTTIDQVLNEMDAAWKEGPS